MTPKARCIISMVIIASIALVLATRPQKPPVVLIVWTAGDSRAEATAVRAEAELQRLSEAAGAAQYLLKLEFGPEPLVYYAGGTIAMDGKWAKLVRRADIVVPCDPAAAGELVARGLRGGGIWVVCVPGDLKSEWNTVVVKAGGDIWLDAADIPVEKAIEMTAMGMLGAHWLWNPGVKVTAPAGVKLLDDPSQPAALDLVLFPAWERAVPTGFAEGVRVVALERHSPDDASHFAAVLNKDTGAMSAAMVRAVLDNRKRIPTTAPTLQLTSLPGAPQ